MTVIAVGFYDSDEVIINVEIVQKSIKANEIGIYSFPDRKIDIQKSVISPPKSENLFYYWRHVIVFIFSESSTKKD